MDIDKLLVVTFTNAAASEMRERVLDAIYKKLEENPDNENLQRQITLLNKSSICTIDSFCLEVVRNNFYELDNVSPNFRIADTTEIELLKQEVIEDIFEKKYEEENQDFEKLITTYTTYKDDTPLKELILKIYNYIQSNPTPAEWLHEKIQMFNLENKLNEDFGNTCWGEILLEEVEEVLIDSIKRLELTEENLSFEPDLDKFQQTIRDDIDKLQYLKNNLENWDKAYKIYSNLTFAIWPKQKVESEIKDEAKLVRDGVKKKVKKDLEKILLCDSQEANQDIFDMYDVLEKLENLILEFEKEFSKRKRDKNIVDFHDIEHFALKILQNKEVSKRYQEKFEEIAIDEYQDSNFVQETILTSISKGNNIFMVGDVKQSIYKFRQAAPELFLEKYEHYKVKEKQLVNDDLKIQLFKNFRSRKNILDTTNIIFENIMSSLLGEIEYNENEYLNLGADYPESAQNLKTEIHIIDLKKEDNMDENSYTEVEAQEEQEQIEDIELEARYVSNQIKKLIDSKFMVWDRKKGQNREIQYRDIAILLRATSGKAQVFEQELANLGIPVFSDSSQEYLDSLEIQTMMCLLKIIDNPMQDIPLVATLRSPIGRFTDDELIQIRLADKQDEFYTCMQKAKISVGQELNKKIENFLTKLEQWRKEQEFLALDELIWKIYSDTSYYNYVGLMSNGNVRQANLKMLFERAKQYETASFKGLYNFIQFIDKLRLSSGDMGAAKVIGENDDVVRIMSIHKSKGLEFPVVFLSNTGKQFNFMDLNENILLHQKMGIGVKYINYEKQVQYDTLSKTAIRSKIKTETLSEEMRVLYVALTRAKEKLFITSLSKDFAKESTKLEEQIAMYTKQHGKINPILVKKYKRYIDWILLTYFYEKQNCVDKIELNVCSKEEAMKSFVKDEQENNDDIINKLEQYKSLEDEQEKIKQIMEHKYEYILSSKIPTKTSVTQIKMLKSEIQKNEDISFNIPKFMEESENLELTSAQKGTLLHLCMQKLDLKKEYDKESIQEFILELVKKDIITMQESKAINVYGILKFINSKIWKEMKNSQLVCREKPFYLHIPAKEIYEENVEEMILVQGVIDLYYINENDELILVDYKTDFVEDKNEENLKLKYNEQLRLYKKALEQALGRKVNKVYIYSTYLGKEIELLLKKQ